MAAYGMTRTESISEIILVKVTQTEGVCTENVETTTSYATSNNGAYAFRTVTVDTLTTTQEIEVTPFPVIQSTSLVNNTTETFACG